MLLPCCQALLPRPAQPAYGVAAAASAQLWLLLQKPPGVSKCQARAACCQPHMNSRPTAAITLYCRLPELALNAPFLIRLPTVGASEGVALLPRQRRHLGAINKHTKHAEATVIQRSIEAARQLTVDAGGGVVLDPQVDVLVDAEAKVAGGGEVAAQQLKLLHLKARLLQGRTRAPGRHRKRGSGRRRRRQRWRMGQRGGMAHDATWPTLPGKRPAAPS